MQLTTPESLDAGAAAAVRALAARVEAEDGAPPLSDRALAGLGSPAAAHVVARAGDELVGYGQLSEDSLELTGEVDALVPLLDAFAGQGFLVWAHGAGSRLTAVLRARGFAQTRGLLQLRRPLGAAGPAPAAPPEVRIAPFVVGADEDAWVEVNAAAFAAHPEQGQWTRADVESREAEPWFDPAGFLLAWQDGELLGFHWTKRHSPTLGEVYVLGVDPAGQGMGLGHVLLARGLDYLRSVGCVDVLLYVEEDNAVARHLYEAAGFTEYDRDTQWRSA